MSNVASTLLPFLATMLPVSATRSNEILFDNVAETKVFGRGLEGHCLGLVWSSKANTVIIVKAISLCCQVGWSLTALSTQCMPYRAFKVRLY